MTTEIEKKLNQIDDKLDLMLQWKAGFEERCIAHNEKTQEVRTIMFDGPDNLLKRVDRLNHIKETNVKSQDFWRSVTKVCIATLIISLATWLFSLYKST